MTWLVLNNRALVLPNNQKILIHFIWWIWILGIIFEWKKKILAKFHNTDMIIGIILEVEINTIL